MSQMALPLGGPAGSADDAFLVTRSNAAAVRVLEDRAAWPVYAALLVGPPRSGRTLLGRLFAQRTGGTVIDDAPGVPEEVLFHAWNAAQERRRPLLLVADPDWTAALPDLRTRIAAGPRAVIGAPDDALARALFTRHFERRGTPAPADLVDWLVARSERSHEAVERIVDRLDRAALEQRRRPTIPLARSLLIDAGPNSGIAPDPLEDA